MIKGVRALRESTTSCFWTSLFRNPCCIFQRVEPAILLMEEIRLTSWDVKNIANTGVNYLSTGAGFLPSTVSTSKSYRSAHCPTSILGQKLCNPITRHAIRRTATTLLQDSTRGRRRVDFFVSKTPSWIITHNHSPRQKKTKQEKNTENTNSKMEPNLALSKKKPSISIAHQNLHLPFFFCAKFQRMDSCRLCKCDWWISLRRCLEVNNLMAFLLSVE